MSERAFQLCEDINHGARCGCRKRGTPCDMILAMLEAGKTAESELRRVEGNRRWNDFVRPT